MNRKDSWGYSRMVINRSRITASIAILIALASAPALPGCSLAEGVIEQATGGNVEVSTGSLPEGWPTEVPVADGEIQFGGFVEEGETSTQVYNVTISIAGDNPTAAIASQLEGAGFTTEVATTPTDDGGALVYTSDAWAVNVLIGRGDGNSFVANYTVASR